MQSRIADSTNALPLALQRPVEQWFERLGEQEDLTALPSACVDALVRVIACSEFAGAVVLGNWRWFVDNVESFAATAGSSSGMPDLLLAESADADEIKAALRRTRNRTLLRILWRDLNRAADLDETLASLSALAEAMLEKASRAAAHLLDARYGRVRDSNGNTVPLVILGMGKLGGRELNFSSDIDLIFLYSEDGETDGARRISAQEYFGRLSRRVIALIDEVTADGFVFRIDTRLRPFGDSGPPVTSFAALESYLLQHGRDWERYAYVKARVVGPDPGREIKSALYGELIQPFVYRRYLDYGVFDSLREMHGMISQEVKRRELDQNVKLGPGGIREAEFVVQSFQLVRGGSEVHLQGSEFQAVLPRLVSSRGLSASSAERLQSAYRFLRRLENLIQAMRDQQTHDIPSDTTDRARLSLAMAYPDWPALQADIDRHRRAIAEEFERVAFRGHSEETPLRVQLVQAWDANASEKQWRDLLASGESHDAAALAKAISSFRAATSTRQIDAVAAERLRRFVPALIIEVIACDEPVVALTRSLGVVERVLRRSAYLALLNENHAAMERLVDLCARSEYLAGEIALYPVLLDELLDPRALSTVLSKSDLAAELCQRLAGVDAGDSEAEVQAIVQYQRATMFRIAVADFSGNLPIMKVSDGLTWLAESVLEAVLQIVWRDLTERHGQPCYVIDDATHKAGFCIVAYGKLGGLELSYGSDLDIVFLHDSRGESQATDGPKPLDNTMFFARLVKRLVHFLTTQTGSGELYEIDTRLRPDGRSGHLVTGTDAFERYQEEHAWTWEHQALLRARAVAGSDKVAGEFKRIRRHTLTRRVKRDSLRQDVISMRQKMRKELDRSDEQLFDLKNGAGGIGDIEFLVQYLVLDKAGEHPDLIAYSDNIRQIDALVEAGYLASADGTRLQDCYRRYRLQQHRQVLNAQPALVPAGKFSADRQFVAQIWGQWLD
ncbi:MAG: bifunctional [glutamate--ammonia ligase]-adenylyl-L-tyrosine phosphorylase/[glutamate--ammonia-ligase] adenylyltransferase [Woeseiaceae bacterium]|nr:bifunctional [glutamate--ammonia ligase]-adenylyl-L-tyrosine phosphorylase/[glutamate--ammonia-ligase] adenylyltransferase [Woeseiaceae bacterium]